jgi:hypothetical protein
MTTTTTTKTTMEQWEEARRQEEAQRHNKQRWRHAKTANYVGIKTGNGASGEGAAVGEGAARDKQQCQQCVHTNDNDNDDDDNNDNIVPIFALFYWLFIVWLIVMGKYFFGRKIWVSSQANTNRCGHLNFVSATWTHLAKIGATSCVKSTCPQHVGNISS